MIKHLFFDIGSTLVDESACDEYRFSHMLSQPGAPDSHILREKMREFSRRGTDPYKAALAEYGLEKCPWPVQLEKLYPGAHNILAYLSAKYSLGIIANQLPGTEERLGKYGILHYFSTITASAEARYAKPDPEIFRIALKKAGCRPEEAMMIGDRLDNDIIPAAKLGMHTAWVRQGIHRFAEPGLCGIVPEYMVIELADLIRFL